MADLSPQELKQILATAHRLKQETKLGIPHQLLAGKAAALLFEKPSLRTRLSFDVGIYQLGGRAVYLSQAEIGLGKRETVADVTRVVSSMCQVIVARVFRHADLLEMAHFSPVPVINALSDYEHPCQVLADLLTIEEVFGSAIGLTLAYIGDGNNMAHSLIYGAVLSGMNINIITPVGYEPDAELVERAREMAGDQSAIVVTPDVDLGTQGAHILYTDVWASMGQEAETTARARVFRNYQINAQNLSHAASNAVVMHCLPAHRDDEITNEVIEGKQSVIFQQAENRLHAQKALLALVV